ncbi:hypothetical protein FDI24_gp027 [Acidovorax phage ACP17]|uniref:Uncharacterized protein n=1 Tax=Acidovorax phage ACP17 TaxID=2010329 RepID=A0A218M3E5_9CAUD|nr:hypothetical protein FDI24_gp027 [Acidovorax phage ACP17]ASD50561.1 hypothetical protein [Acidovorax phage ACP17]
MIDVECILKLIDAGGPEAFAMMGLDTYKMDDGARKLYDIIMKWNDVNKELEDSLEEARKGS